MSPSTLGQWPPYCVILYPLHARPGCPLVGYIIDPTGTHIKEQRDRERAKKNLAKLTEGPDTVNKKMAEVKKNFINKKEKESAQAAGSKDLGTSPALPSSAEAATMSTSISSQKTEVARMSNSNTFLSHVTVFPAWDVLTMAALLFTVIVTPFEVGFMKAPETIEDLNTLFYMSASTVTTNAAPNIPQARIRRYCPTALLSTFRCPSVSLLSFSLTCRSRSGRRVHR